METDVIASCGRDDDWWTVNSCSSLVTTTPLGPFASNMATWSANTMLDQPTKS
jgi:hypothetical protein